MIEVRHRLGTDFDDEELWAKWMALFTEAWPHDDGPACRVLLGCVRRRVGERFGAEHVVVDADRVTVPISATQIREDPGAHLHHLAPAGAGLGRGQLALNTRPDSTDQPHPKLRGDARAQRNDRSEFRVVFGCGSRSGQRLGCLVTRRYGLTVFQPAGNSSLASSSETAGTMMTSSPSFQFAGVATL